MVQNEILSMAESLISIRDLDALMENILKIMRKILAADAGSIFIHDAESDALVFKYTQNDSMNIPFKEFSIPLDTESIAGYAGVHHQILRIDDVYNIDDECDYQFNNDFDQMSGYRTKAMISIPICNRHGGLIGVVQLINKLDGTCFTKMDESTAFSLSGILAVALENSILYDNIEVMWEGFIKASIHAIEARDVVTSGHTERVTRLTLATAVAMADDQDCFPEFTMTDNEYRTLKYACLLHDFGKIGVRESVLNKAKKLSDDRLVAIITRCRLAKACMQFHDDLAFPDGFFDECIDTVIKANEPAVVEDDISDKLNKFSQVQFTDMDGCAYDLLEKDEVDALRIKRGSLTDDEIIEMRSHVLHSYHYLRKIPWTKELKEVPSIACMHHERMDGTGYPFGLKGAEIPLMGRIMAVVDMFDALISADRPYKRALTYAEVSSILKSEAKCGILDEKVVNFFIDEGIYKK